MLGKVIAQKLPVAFQAAKAAAPKAAAALHTASPFAGIKPKAPLKADLFHKAAHH
jgi:hypothetical protein